ncbi:MAG: OsmC family protein [Candidatus Methylomirabilales bacterium]
MSVTMRMDAQRKGWDLGEVEVQLEAEKSDKGVISGIKMHIELGGALSEEERSRIKEIATRCPTHKVLSTGVSIVQV